MPAYDVAKRIAEARGWSCTPQPFSSGQARLMVHEEQRWLGVTAMQAQSVTYGANDVVLLHAGDIREDGTPASPVTETSAQSKDMEGLLRELQRMWELWERLGENDRKAL
ncbi:hypothetical protein [Streptomyces viridochromogenes]|uniref:hypothetical protein n=1 Tax=Streptomyces viridochromogenes TaxID=1938 RepID=UPI00069D9EB8|nr:hypothetical protein [Streptomyces viridochromogenes]KOG26158.1 hypothetical protein ADK36_03750 [Streptomyces viridochromogenes]KOG27684.1 hypothetical protein ADK35_04985 [Streptomyces viridochromogenes]